MKPDEKNDLLVMKTRRFGSINSKAPGIIKYGFSNQIYKIVPRSVRAGVMKRYFRENPNALSRESRLPKKP